MSRIIVFGSSGFIGRNLLKALGHEGVKTIKSSSVYNWSSEELSGEIDNCEIIINVAGLSVFSLWTKKRKEKIYQSRINFTDRIREAVSLCKNPPSRFISASAVGIYKSFIPVDEHSHEFGDNFLAHTVIDWENACLKLKSSHTTVTLMRFGIVLGRGGGAYKILRFLCKFNLGGYFGKGDQPVSFIWIDDLVRAVIFIIERNLTGIVNITAPGVTNYKEIVKTLNRKFKSRLLWPIPAFILKLMGDASVMYLEGQTVKSKVLTKNNFNFEASDIIECVDKIEAS